MRRRLAPFRFVNSARPNEWRNSTVVSREEVVKAFNLKAVSLPQTLYKLEKGWGEVCFTTHKNRLTPSQLFFNFKMGGIDPQTIDDQFIPDFAIERFSFGSNVLVGLIDKKKKILVFKSVAHIFAPEPLPFSDAVKKAEKQAARLPKDARYVLYNDGVVEILYKLSAKDLEGYQNQP